MKAVRWRKFALVTFRWVFSWTDFMVAEPYEKSRVGPCRPCTYFYRLKQVPRAPVLSMSIAREAQLPCDGATDPVVGSEQPLFPN
jgi:hypothetical protein